MKKLMVLACVAACAAAAVASEYTWTGYSDAGTPGAEETADSWKDPDNWTPYGYPHEAGDVAVFPAGKAEVVLDTGVATPIKTIRADAGADVTITAGEGSSFSFADGGATALDGGKLTLDVPSTSSTRFDSRADGPNGDLHVAGLVNVAGNVQIYHTYAGTVTYEGEGGLATGWSSVWFGNGGAPAETSRIVLKDSARISALGNAFMGTNGGVNANPSVSVEQDGADTLFKCYGLHYGYAGTYPSDNFYSYTLKDGTFTSTDDGLIFYPEVAGEFVQKGGTANVPKITFNSARAKVRLEGGTMKLPSAAAVTAVNPGQVEVAGGTLEFSGDATLTPAFYLSGSPTVKIDAGKTLDYARMVAAPETRLTVTGGGTLEIRQGFEASGSELVIEQGKAVVSGDLLVEARKGSYEPWKITVGDGAQFVSTKVSTHYAVPLELDIRGSGQVVLPCGIAEYGSTYNRTCLIAHKLTVGGVEQPKGRYASSAHSFVVGSGSYTAIVVPYVWTGAGDGIRWNDPNNWDTKTVPPSGGSTSVDLSRATTVRLESAVTVGTLVAMPNGDDRTVTITGSAPLYTSGGYLECAIYVAEGRELVFDVPVGNDVNTVNAILGGGTVRVRNSFPFFVAGLYAAYSLDGKIVHQGPVWQPSGTLVMNDQHEAAGVSCVEIAAGSEWTSKKMVYHLPGFYPVTSVRQTGGTVKADEFHVDMHSAPSDKVDCTYHLEGGSLTATTAFDLGVYYDPGQSESRRGRYPGSSFEMSGDAVLTVPSVAVSCNQTYLRLCGGTLNLEGRMYRDTNTDYLQQFSENVVPFEFGGVTLNATGSASVEYNSALTGKGGDFVFNTADHDCAFAAGYSISGSGSMVKRGSAKLTIAQTCAFSGALTVEAGKVDLSSASTLAGPRHLVVKGADSRLAVNGVVTVSPRTVVLDAAENLSLAEGVTLTVESLTVGGVAQTGSQTFGNGSVVVVPRTSWIDGDRNGDLSGVGAEQTLSASVSLASLVYLPADAGSVTLKGASGQTVTFEAGASVTVARGSTLVIDADVVLGGAVNVLGGGAIRFLRSVTSAVEPGSGENVYKLVVRQGEADFAGAVTGVALVTCGRDGDRPAIALSEGCTVSNYAQVLTAYAVDGSGKCFGETRQKGATVDLTTGFDGRQYLSCNLGGYGKWTLTSGSLVMPPTKVRFLVNAGESSNFDFVMDGGSLTAPSGFYLACGESGQHITFTLNGGVLRLGSLIEASNYPAMSALALNGGTVETSGSMTPFPAVTPLTMSGTAAFRQANAGDVVMFAHAVSAQAIVQEGPGTLVLAKFGNGTALDVRGGILSVGPSAAGVDSSASVAVADGAKLALNFDGELSVETLTAKGKERRPGTYGASVGPEALRGLFSGSGRLNARNGTIPGFTVIVR